MDAVLDTLHNALRPFPCKWEGCSATLASWKLLVKVCALMICQGFLLFMSDGESIISTASYMPQHCHKM